MADEIPPEEIAKVRSLVVAAICASPPIGSNAAAWRGQVEMALAEIHVVLNPYGRLMQRAHLYATAPTQFWGVYLG